MVSFTRNEIISASQFVRNFATLLKTVCSSKEEKIAIVKNNQMQAVLIPIEEYEKLKSYEEQLEQKEIYETIQSRKSTPQSEYISYKATAKCMPAKNRSE